MTTNAPDNCKCEYPSFANVRICSKPSYEIFKDWCDKCGHFPGCHSQAGGRMMDLIERLKALRLKAHHNLTECALIEKADLDKAISTLESFQWIPVSERLPEFQMVSPEISMSKVLISTESGEVKTAIFVKRPFSKPSCRGPHFEIIHQVSLPSVTHWMPLPVAPTKPAAQ